MEHGACEREPDRPRRMQMCGGMAGAGASSRAAVTGRAIVTTARSTSAITAVTYSPHATGPRDPLVAIRPSSTPITRSRTAMARTNASARGSSTTIPYCEAAIRGATSAPTPTATSPATANASRVHPINGRCTPSDTITSSLGPHLPTPVRDDEADAAGPRRQHIDDRQDLDREGRRWKPSSQIVSSIAMTSRTSSANDQRIGTISGRCRHNLRTLTLRTALSPLRDDPILTDEPVFTVDSKNRRTWQNTFVTKLRRDQLEAEAQHAILATAVFPSGERELCLRDGVIVIAPARTTFIVQLLRSSMVRMHVQGLSVREREAKMGRLYAYITSEACAQRFREAGQITDDLLALDVEETKDHQNVWARRGRMTTRLQGVLRTLDAEIAAIVEDADNGAGGNGQGPARLI
jgi:hypothetical protein